MITGSVSPYDMHSSPDVCDGVLAILVVMKSNGLARGGATAVVRKC